MRFDTIPEEMKRTNQWVCAWNGSKIPMQASVRKAASSTDPSTWSSFAEAKQAVDSGMYDYLGYVFNGDGLIGIDIDRGYDDDGFLSDLAVDCMRACKSYTEQSRSGRGIHIYVRGNLPFVGANNRNGAEIYATRRYFIVTGERLIYGNIIENQDAIDYILGRYFRTELRQNSGERKERIYTPVYTVVSGKVTLSYPKITPGMRNLSLTSLAGQMHSRGYSHRDIFRELLKVNERACEPPLDREEVVSIVRSVTKYQR